ncbi:MAG TPA: hypothetical protein VHG28_17470 [Longimicrobiaceae bacterium]|nr:hypothetical protein [Longimicrobiaceae bacterium]
MRLRSPDGDLRGSEIGDHDGPRPETAPERREDIQGIRRVEVPVLRLFPAVQEDADRLEWVSIYEEPDHRVDARSARLRVLREYDQALEVEEEVGGSRGRLAPPGDPRIHAQDGVHMDRPLRALTDAGGYARPECRVRWSEK